MVAAAVAAVLPSEATMNSFNGLFGAATGSPIRMLTPQNIAYNQMLAARLNSTSAAQFYTHSLFPWQMTPITYSPPISPVPLAYKADKENVVTASGEVNDLYLDNQYIDFGNVSGRLDARKMFNFTKNRNQISYQPYSNLKPSPMGSTGSISPGPTSPPTSYSSASLSPSSLSSLIHSTSPNQDASPSPRDKSFKCQICNRSFGYKHVLQNHMRTHTGEKPYSCTECGKRFTRDHHLKTHIRLHTGERPYQCKQCNQTFVQVANLRRHMRVHIGKQQNMQRAYENALLSVASKQPSYGVALDLSVETNSKNGEKETDPRRIACEQKTMKIECSNALEQSEPEDLSMHSSRIDASQSPNDEDLLDLDDAESLNRKQQLNKKARNKMR